MKKKKISISKVLLWLFFIGIILMFCYRYYFLLPKVEKEGKFTIGTVVDWSSKKGGAYNVYFTYEIRGKKYKEFSNASFESIKKIKKNSRFLVVFLENKNVLGNSGIILENPIPDTVKVAPYEGWEEKPIWAK